MPKTEKNLITLNSQEKKIHVIWIGQLPDKELDNLKIWAKLNPDFEINIWTDSNHVLTPKLKTLLTKKSSDILDKEFIFNPLSLTKLQLDFI